MQLLSLHPDKTLGRSTNESTIIGHLKEAYSILLDQQLRNEYDRHLLEKAKKQGMNADGVGLDQYSLDEFTADEIKGIWSMACPRCESEGGMELNEGDLENGTTDGEFGLQLALQCQSCSLWIKVKYYMGDDEEEE
ncbi:Diphthamide biosynthesis protein 4 [Scheffersomyces spartinae]|uniref:Diphthamide biosynthesis protein 4 n=1 Tax=Scheffersomyces spartinae TaxID=45513 RepID=A0A9P7VE20_9ASCO|nr:Diphthamide biosynthesis protein 4 [Scheffersomyces spartinae]KAG7196115.1 Diphthamide biosynthesis protein 4 [Scheffersomyces spartinae]